MEVAEVVTRPQREAKEIPRDLSCSSKEAATDEEDESATSAEAGPDAAHAEAARITPLQSRIPPAMQQRSIHLMGWHRRTRLDKSRLYAKTGPAG